VGTASPWVTPPRSLRPARHDAASWPKVPAGRRIRGASGWAGRFVGPAAAGVLIVIILGRAAATIARRHAG
jgi:predicted lipid-binding transport protein (Tim44 family)